MSVVDVAGGSELSRLGRSAFASPRTRAVDIDAPIGTYLHVDLGHAAHRAVTLRNLLQALSSVEVNQVRGLNFFADQSRAREFFTMPMVNEPGTYFEYDQTAISACSQRSTPRPGNLTLRC